MKTRVLCLALLTLLLAGCESGTWEDSPKNWERAFGSSKPQDAEVVHSKYWRSPHWTYECEYFFHIRANETLRKQIFDNNVMVKCSDLQGREPFFGNKPDWFIPKPIDDYDVWMYKDEPGGNFRLFIDKETGDLFLSDNQV